MMTLLIGGVIPMVFFGLMDFLYRRWTLSSPFESTFFHIGLGGSLLMVAANFGVYQNSVDQTIELFTPANVGVGIGLGILWTLAICCLGYAYEVRQANATQIVPISASSGMFSAFIGVLCLGEETSLTSLLISTLFIVGGIWVLSLAQKKNTNLPSPIMAILVGGFGALVFFGILNVAFKYFSAINPAFLGFCMGITAIVCAMGIRFVRYRGMTRPCFSFRPKLMLLGLVWGTAVIALGYGFWPMGGEASVLLPIVSSSLWVTVLLSALFADEPVFWKRVLVGTGFVFVGILVLQVL